MDIRPATLNDAADILSWRNDPHTRSMFVSSQPVSEVDHLSWLKRILVDPHRILLIGENAGTKVGICRFDIDPVAGSAEVSINLAPEMRGQGLSSELLGRSIEVASRLFRGPLTAKIRQANRASIRCFEACGFLFERDDPHFSHYRRPA